MTAKNKKRIMLIIAAVAVAIGYFFRSKLNEFVKMIKEKFAKK